MELLLTFMQPAQPTSTSSSSLKLERQKLISKLFQYSKSGKTRGTSKLSKRINIITSQLSRLQSKNLPSLMYTNPPPNNPKTSGKAQTGLNLLPEPIRNVISNKMATNENTPKSLDLPKVSTKDDGLVATSFFIPLSKPPHSTELSNQTTTKESSQLNKSLTKAEKLQAFYETMHMNPSMPYPLYPPANNYPLQSGHTRNFDANPRNRFNHQEPQCRETFLRYLDSIPIFTGRSHEDLQSFVEVCDRIDNICENESEYGEFLTRVKFQLRGKAYQVKHFIQIRISGKSRYSG